MIWREKRQIFRGRRTTACMGANNEPCPYTSACTDDNTLLTWRIDIGTKKHYLQLDQRCFLCSQTYLSREDGRRNRQYLRKMAGKCAYSMYCEDDVPSGDVLCVAHREKMRNSGEQRPQSNWLNANTSQHSEVR